MATKYEQALALSKEKNIPVPEAVAQVRNQAVTPVTTPVAPTTNVIDQMAGKTVAERQAIRSGQPAPVTTTPTPAPVTSSTTPSGATMNADGTVTPVTTMPQKEVKQFNENGELINPTAQDVATYNQNVQTFTPSKDVQPAKQVTPKTEAPIDYNQAQGREQDIIKNLDTFKAQNMTPEQIMRASGYQNATPEKKALIDPYLKQQVPTASAMYNAIATKADIPDEQKTTLPFKIAQNRYTKASSFSSMTASQLANEMQNSRFIQGSQAYEDVKAMNPKLIQDTENLRIVNGGKQNVFTYINNPDGTSTKVNNLEKTFAEEYMDNFGDVIKKMFAVQTPEQIKAIIYTDDVKQAQDKATEIELTMNELEKQMDNVDADVDKEMAGSGATGSRIALEKASRKDKLGKEYNSQLKNYTTYANKANNLITQNTTVYTTQQQQKQAQNAAMLPFLQDQYKTEQEKLKAQEALNDPYKAIPAMIEEYKKLGIPFARSTQQIIKDFESSGKDISTFLTDLQTTIQSKPEYQAYKDKQSGTEWQSTSITRYNPATGANESTPIFYRKKTNGGFEAVDLAGNKLDASVLSGGVSTGTISATGDMSGLASNYPYEASFKNNNTSGITWGMSANTKKLLENAGIKISEGTARPSREGGKYVKFDNIADGLLAHKILLSQAGSDDINARLQQWVGTKEGPTYAKNLMDQAGIPNGTKFSQLTPDQLDKLVMVQIKKESPGMYKELTKGTTGTTETPLQQVSASDQKAFESYDGKSIPEQYKTPAEKKAFVDKYNAWRASRPGTKIETGNDLINIKLDKPTEGQQASMSFGARMIDAAKNIQQYEDAFTKLPLAQQIYESKAPELLTSQNQKSLMREKMDFITAVLRKESGAAISPSEFSGQDKIFFPQPGDGPEVLLAKRNARNFRVKAMLATAGTDTEGNSVSKYYNPPIITNETESTTPVKTDKISTLKKNYFQ